MRFDRAFALAACALMSGWPTFAAAACDDPQAILRAGNYVRPSSDHLRVLVNDGAAAAHREELQPSISEPALGIATDGAGGAYVLHPSGTIDVLRRDSLGNYRTVGTITGPSTGLHPAGEYPSLLAADRDEVCALNGETSIYCFSTKRWGDVAPERVIIGGDIIFGKSTYIVFRHDGTLVAVWRYKPGILFYDKNARGQAMPSFRIDGERPDFQPGFPGYPSAVAVGPDDRLYVRGYSAILVYGPHAQGSAAPLETFAPHGFSAFTVDAGNRFYASTLFVDHSEIETYSMQKSNDGHVSQTLLATTRTLWPIDSLTSDGLGGFIASEYEGRQGSVAVYFKSLPSGELVRVGRIDSKDAAPAVFASLPEGDLAALSQAGTISDLQLLPDGTFHEKSRLFEGYHGVLSQFGMFASSPNVGAYLDGATVTVFNYAQHTIGTISGPDTHLGHSADIGVDTDGTIVVVTGSTLNVYDSGRLGNAPPIRTFDLDIVRRPFGGLLTGPDGTLFAEIMNGAPAMFSSKAPVDLDLELQPISSFGSKGDSKSEKHFVLHCKNEP